MNVVLVLSVTFHVWIPQIFLIDINYYRSQNIVHAHHFKTIVVTRMTARSFHLMCGKDAHITLKSFDHY